jgi:hypothetical protein
MKTRPQLSAIEHSSGNLSNPLAGTPSQIDWALGIRTKVGAEFNRVAETLRTASGKQSAEDRLDTQAIIAILDEKRAEVLGRPEAGYFILNWQELTDQVRLLIRKDPRYQAIRLAKAERNRPADRVEAPMPLRPETVNT